MTATRSTYTLSLPDRRQLTLGPRTLVMGVINVTPDSFSDGGACLDPDRALEAALQLEADGADLIDIGGESTRPGAGAIGIEAESARVLPVVERVAHGVAVPVSVDTYKAEVARRALGAGAVMVNDISTLRYDPALAGVVAAAGAPLVLMHNRGRSREMYRDAHYDRAAEEVVRELAAGVRRAERAGVAVDQIAVDPGLGFAKQATHTFETLAGLRALERLDRPVVVGPSRKSFLDRAIGTRAPADREWGTAAAVAAAVLLGAHVVRVHRVREMVDVVRVIDEVLASAARVEADPCPTRC